MHILSKDTGLARRDDKRGYIKTLGREASEVMYYRHRKLYLVPQVIISTLHLFSAQFKMVHALRVMCSPAAYLEGVSKLYNSVYPHQPCINDLLLYLMYNSC